MIDFDAHKLIVPQAPPIPLLHNSPHVPHLSQVQVALSPNERLIFVRQLLARFLSLALQPTHATTISFPEQHVIHTRDDSPIHMATRPRSPLVKSQLLINRPNQVKRKKIDWIEEHVPPDHPQAMI